MIVTVDEVKTHLRIEHNEEDSYIEGLIKQAQAEAEALASRRALWAVQEMAEMVDNSVNFF